MTGSLSAQLLWTPSVPPDWGLKRGKFLFTREQRPVRSDDDVVTAFRDGTVTLRRLRREDGFTFADKEIGYQGVRKGDLVIHAMDGFAGAIGVSDSDGKCSPVYSICTPRGAGIEPRFYAALLRHLALSGFISSLAKGIRERSTDFRFGEFADLWLPLPPEAQQRAIANFLDRKTATIDALIQKKERQIELLEEKRQALITRAVTKGLDPNVPMKDSGMAWLGQIPAHWTVVPLSYFCRIYNGSTPSREEPAFWDGGAYPWLNSSKVNEGRITTANQFVTDRAVSECHLPLVPAGTVVMAITGEGKTRGTAALLTFSATTSQHIAAILPKGRVTSEFLWRYLSSLYEWLRFESSEGGSTKAAITCEFLRTVRVVIPSLSEQAAICSRVDDIAGQTDELVGKARKLLDLLREYRQALISAAVTGKIEIPAEEAA